MRKAVKQRVRHILRMNFIAAVACMLPGLSHGQTTPAVQQQFAAIDESLMQKADVLLAASAFEGKVGTSTWAEVGESTDPSGVNSRNPQKADGRKGSTAAARLDRWRPLVTPIIEEEGVPAEFAAVILVESGGNPMALSSKGARGLWQLMPDTARRYGLTVDGMVDDRLNVVKSTHAAARYLRDLYIQFGSWPLALAAYNAGEQNLQRAIDRSRSNEFSVLSTLGLLPLETRNYVPAVLTAMQLTGRSFVPGGRRSPTTTIVFALDGN